MERKFKVSDTAVCKGMAVCLLLFHHLFYEESRYAKAFFIFYDEDGIPLLSKLAVDARVCVAIFLILSGIGMYIKLDKEENTAWLNQYRKVLSSVKKLMITFWTVFIIFVFISQIVGKTLQLTYGNDWLKNLCIDFFGMTYLFKTPTMNGAWWYITVAIFCYLSAPILYNVLQKMKSVMAAVTIICIIGKDYLYPSHGIWQIFFYMLFFALGMCFGKYMILDRCMFLLQKSPFWQKVFLFLPAIGLAEFVRHKTGIIFDWIYAPLLIIFACCVLSEVHILTKALKYIGKYSDNIFLCHSFFYSQFFFFEQLYKLKYPVFIFFALLFMSLISSIGLRYIQNSLYCAAEGGKRHVER